MMKNDFYIKKRQELVSSMKDNSLLILHSGVEYQKSADENYPFTVNRNFYYFTGIIQSNVTLAIVKSKEIKEFLFIEENDPIQVKWVGAKLYKEEASKISGIKDVIYSSQFKFYLFNFLNPSRSNYYEITNLYVDLERRDGFTYKTWPVNFADEVRRGYPEINVLNIYQKMIYIRTHKETVEVELIKESIKTTKGGLESIMKNLRPNIYEYQLETYFDSYIKWDNHKTWSFDTICAQGKNATTLHYRNNDDLLVDGNLVLLDLGCQTELYCSDITRTYPINGKFSKRQREVYEVVLECNKKCFEFLKPGVTWKEYNDFANAILCKGLKKLGLIKEDSELRKYYWHSIGHSLGLDTHDPNLSNLPIECGTVTSVEPGLYIAEEGIGIRIEDDALITKDGCVCLSKDIIKEVDDIEAFMKKNK